MPPSVHAYEELTLNRLLPYLTRHELTVASCNRLVGYSHVIPGGAPILLLLHGYPQSAYIWRHVAKSLEGKVSFFIPELPAYGISASPKDDVSPSTMAQSILESCEQLFPGRDLIFGGHDRGARICHRMAVDHGSKSPRRGFKLLGCILIDIVPTLHQWKSFSSAKTCVGYFHWPFLASAVAADMISLFGGGKWTHLGLERLAGDNAAGRATLTSDRAWDVYESVHDTRAAIEGSCADYKSGALVEPELQERDQRDGKKIEVPTLVIWSERNLGSAHGRVGEIWRDWIGPEVPLTTVPAGGGVGHYLPEEAPELISTKILEFLDQL